MVKRKKNESLKNYTTMKTGGNVEILSIPESEEDLVSEIKYCLQNNIPYKILGNGSNIIVKDHNIKGFVIYNKKSLNNIKLKKNKVIVGSSVMLQEFINFCVKNNLEGMEYLYSIPGTIGGSIYMNAGRGGSHNKQISDKLKKIKIFDGNKTFYISKTEAEFKYRESIFHNKPNWTILEAEFELENQTEKIGKKKIKERMNYVKEHQLRNKPSVGSIYKYGASSKILKLLSFFRKGNCKFNGNWITNYGHGKTKDILFLIKLSNVIHKIFMKDPVLEIEIW